MAAVSAAGQVANAPVVRRRQDGPGSVFSGRFVLRLVLQLYPHHVPLLLNDCCHSRSWREPPPLLRPPLSFSAYPLHMHLLAAF